MEKSRRTRRVSFGELGESTRSRSESKSESFRGYEEEEARRKMRMNMEDYNAKESEFAASIAAAAYAIHSLEETRANYERLMVDSFRESFRDRESFREPKTKSKSIKLDPENTIFDFNLPSLGRSARRSSSQIIDNQDAGVTRHVPRQGEGIRRTSTRPIEIGGAEQQREGVTRVETKADAWERARLEKINKWYEKMNKKIQVWENEKKKRANIDMERRKAELDRLKRVTLLHYENKIDWIEGVSGGARKQLEEKKISEEAYARDKANKSRSTGRVPVQCFCFEY